MKAIKKVFQNNLKSYNYFYKHLKHRIFVAVILSSLVGILDGFGLSMFLPLLELVNEDSTVEASTMGNLEFIVDFFRSLGFELNLITILIFLCVFFTFKGLAQLIRSTYQVVVQQFFVKKIRLNLINSLNNLSYKAFVNSDVGRIQNTVSGEVDRVSRAYQTYFTAFQYFVLVLVYTGFAFFIDYQFAILVTVGGVFSNLLYTYVYKKTKKESAELTAESHVFQSLIIQYVSNFKYLKSSGLLNNYSLKLEKSVNKIEENNKKIGFMTSIVVSSREPLMIIVVCSVIFIQIYVLGASLGPILISLLFFYRSLASLTMMQNWWNMFISVSGSLGNMEEFTEQLELNRESTGEYKVQKIFKNIGLKDVSFSYGATPILKGIDLVINKNEVVAFVGESGSGKTTLLNILVGLMPPSSGELTIDEKRVEEINIFSYQKRIGYITQDPVIFNDSIFNNITFWDEYNAKNLIKFKEALKKASLSDFVENLDEKEKNLLGNHGVNLSGGQKQRISIARELYKEIDILVLDEATSALDSETEREIQDNLNLLKGSYTILIVAHRLSTIKNADKIVLLKNGVVASIGTFDELLDKSKNFKNMVELQEV